MRAQTVVLSKTVSLVTEECCNCSVLFAMTEEMYDRRLRDKKWFYCPNGHVQHYKGVSDEERIKRLEASLSAERDQRDAAERSVRAQKAQSTKLRRKLQRVENGVCPHCNRTFQNLARHMETKHHE